MSRGREVEDKEVEEEEIEDDEFEEQEYEEEGEDYYDYGDEPGDDIIGEIDRTKRAAPWIVYDGSRPEKIRRCDTNPCLDHNWRLSSSGHGRLDSDLAIKPQDADYCSNLPQLSDELGTMILPELPGEVEVMIIARIPILEFRKLCLLNKRYQALITNGDLLEERRLIGVRGATVFMLASGEDNWCAYDQQFTFHKALPILPSDGAFKCGDKESVCAGTHLLVCGNEIEGPVIWTYDVILNNWFKGYSMIEPRCLFASASSGDFAFVAGGIGLESKGILDSAEKYDPATKSWEPLPRMKEQRQMCSGVYMDNKFYVFGGQNPSGDALTCAEVFDENKNTWVKIPGILNGITLGTARSPPLVAVVDNELYTIETSTNSLMVYLKNSNSWKDLGPVPVRADVNKGWGVAFKSLGNELLVMGGSNISLSARGMTIYTCRPNPNAQELAWKLVDGGGNSRSHYIMNCTVMVA